MVVRQLCVNDWCFIVRGVAFLLYQALDGSDDDKLFCFRENRRGIQLLRSARPPPKSVSTDDSSDEVANDEVDLDMSVYDEGAAVGETALEDEENEPFIDEDDSDESDVEASDDDTDCDDT